MTENSRNFRRIFGVVMIVAILSIVATGVGAQLFVDEKAEVTMVTDRTAYVPGARVGAVAVLEIEPHWHVNANPPTLDFLIPTEVTPDLPPGASGIEIHYPRGSMLSFEFTDEPIAVYEGTAHLGLAFDLPADVEEGALSVPVAVRYQACNDSTCLPPVTVETTLALEIGDTGIAVDHPAFAAAFDSGPTGSPTTTAAAASSSAPIGWLSMLFAALLGGLILNAMPCVLPVLSLKVFGLMRSAEEGRREVVVGGLATTAGILVSFWALAAAAIGAKAAGSAVGWGIQFQQPGFVAFLAVVVVLFSLNMWGLFEIPLPARLAQVGGGGKNGVAGHFASGLFATLMATPCSAPFLGTAVGFALGQSALAILAIFTAIGLGLALPYLALAIMPKLGALLPKPGPWMVTLRGMMGFLLAAAAVWLFYVLSAQIDPSRVAFVQIALLVLAMFTWLFQRTAVTAGRRFAAGGIAVAAIAGIVLAATSAPRTSAGPSTSSHHEWLAFDEQEAVSLAAAGQPVFVDVTADWCLTCKTNEHLVLETKAVAEAFRRHGVVTMKADWTNRDDVITDYLARFGKSSIPFYVLYRPGTEPFVFGELLTKGRVFEALEGVATVTASVNRPAPSP